MQERQTQVLALPARFRETEGILRKVRLCRLTAEIHSVPRNSRHLRAGGGDTDPCQMCEVHRGWERGTLLSFSLSDGLSPSSV